MSRYNDSVLTPSILLELEQEYEKYSHLPAHFGSAIAAQVMGMSQTAVNEWHKRNERLSAGKDAFGNRIFRRDIAIFIGFWHRFRLAANDNEPESVTGWDTL